MVKHQLAFDVISITCFYIACVNDFSGALFWNNSRRNLLVTHLCSELHPNFRSGVEIVRKCNNDGNWSPVDMTTCTMFLDSNPVLVVYFTVILSDSSRINSTNIINNVSIYSYNTANLKSTTYVVVLVVCAKIHILLYIHCRLLIRFN